MDWALNEIEPRTGWSEAHYAAIALFLQPVRGRGCPALALIILRQEQARYKAFRSCPPNDVKRAGGYLSRSCPVRTGEPPVPSTAEPLRQLAQGSGQRLRVRLQPFGPAALGCTVITGELKSKIDRIWDAFWSGGISNPLEVIEQITYLLFIRRLDDLQTLAEKKANRTGKPIENPVFQPGQADLRWSRFKDLEPGVMHKVVGEQVFPFLRQLGGDGSTYSEHMKDARFTIPTPALLSRVVDMLDDVPMQDRDTNGDLYEYMLSKIATAGRTASSGRRGTSSSSWSR